MTAGTTESVEIPRKRRRLRRWLAPLLFGLLCLVVFNANMRTIGAGDSFGARYLPLVVLKDHSLKLDAHEQLVARGHPVGKTPKQTALPGDVDYVNYFSPYAYWLVQAPTGHTLSMYPVVTPLLVTPLFYPAYKHLERNGWQQPQLDRVAEISEKGAASLIAAISAVLMLVLLRRERIPWALPLAAAFAFGTTTWVISSQALWQHGMGALLVVLALLLTTRERSAMAVAALGFVCGVMVANRPPDAIIAAGFAAFVIWRDWRDLKWLAAGAALPAIALLVYNQVLIGNPVGGYIGNDVSKADGPRGRDEFLRGDLFGIPGLLISPGRGLLVFSPFLIFVPIGLAQRLKNPATKRLAIALTAALLVQLVIYSQTDWRAGAAWGPRWLTSMLPILVWMLAPGVAALRPTGRGLLAGAIAASIAIQVVGAFWYTGVSDERVLAGPKGSMAAAWKPANLPYLVELGHRPASRELLCNARGSIDRVGTTLINGDGTIPELTPGAAIDGWALTCNNRSPAQVLTLVDGVIVGASGAFLQRPDVDRTLGTTAPSGWHVDANTHGVRPGRHVLQLAVRIGPRSDVRIVRQLDVNVPAAPGAPANNELPTLATRAAQQLGEHQLPSGAWLTTFTGAPRYQSPTQELNTYTPALLHDLLEPVAAGAGLTAQLQRTRSFLRGQIEPGGLVRYHGLPDAPTIGTLGCAITPDSDDTSLTWRIAGRGAADPRSRSMLRTLGQYRTGQGLYRTWLAPQSRFECIDPGKDPNPTDLVNQMHIWMMLRKLDRPAATQLCAAMQRAVAAPGAFAYYVKSPLVVYLRSAQLTGLGCRLPLPTDELAKATPGQEPWAQLTRTLVATLSTPPNAAQRRSIERLLTELGRDDFTLLRRTPPLLYSNDPTASVSRFYWSEDVGYALWLRLHATLSEQTP